MKIQFFIKPSSPSEPKENENAEVKYEIDSSQCIGSKQSIEMRMASLFRQASLANAAARFFENHRDCVKVIVSGAEEDIFVDKITSAFVSYQKIKEGKGDEEPSKFVSLRLGADILKDFKNPTFIVTFCLHQNFSSLPLSASSSFQKV